MDFQTIWILVLTTFVTGLLFGMWLIWYLEYCGGRQTGSQTGSTPNLKKILTILTRQTARWSIAAEQDENPLIAVLHANYGAGYLWAIKDIASHKEVKEATGIDLAQLTEQVTSIQDKASMRLIKSCPRIGTSNKYLARIAKE